MTYSFKLDEQTNDFIIDPMTKSLKLVEGDEEILQRVAVTLRCEVGTYEFDLEKGVPYYESIIGSKDHKSIELMLRKIISEVIGVKRVLVLSIDKKPNTQREYVINCKFETVNSNLIDMAYNVLDIQAMQTTSINSYQ